MENSKRFEGLDMEHLEVSHQSSKRKKKGGDPKKVVFAFDPGVKIMFSNFDGKSFLWRW